MVDDVAGASHTCDVGWRAKLCYAACRLAGAEFW